MGVVLYTMKNKYRAGGMRTYVMTQEAMIKVLK